MAKYLWLSTTFFFASFFQVIIVVLGKQIGFSQFAIQFTPFKVVHHFLVGQILGYTIYYLVHNVIKTMKKNIAFMVGCGGGIIAWMVVIIAGLKSGLIQSTWLQFGGVVTTLAAFVGYGAICGLTSYIRKQE